MASSFGTVVKDSVEVLLQPALGVPAAVVPPPAPVDPPALAPPEPLLVEPAVPPVLVVGLVPPWPWVPPPDPDILPPDDEVVLPPDEDGGEPPASLAPPLAAPPMPPWLPPNPRVPPPGRDVWPPDDKVVEPPALVALPPADLPPPTSPPLPSFPPLPEPLPPPDPVGLFVHAAATRARKYTGNRTSARERHSRTDVGLLFISEILKCDRPGCSCQPDAEATPSS